MRNHPSNLEASILHRLRNCARKMNADPKLIHLWYGIERFLYRLSQSKYREKFVLKGALLFRVWEAEVFRPTRDIDVLAFLDTDAANLRQVITEIADMQGIDDGLTFDRNSIRMEIIRQTQEYGGYRVNLHAQLGVSVIPLQIDVGFGDAINPQPTVHQYPTLLEFPPPMLRMYPRETVVAEKFEAIVSLGLINSRMKDFYDLWVLSRRYEFDGRTLSKAIGATFFRRGTSVPSEIPLGLGHTFATDPSHQRQWAAFLNREIRDLNQHPKLEDVLDDLASFLMPAAAMSSISDTFLSHWRLETGWQKLSEPPLDKPQ